MEFSYRSPFEGDAGLVCQSMPTAGYVIWSYQGIGTLIRSK